MIFTTRSLLCTCACAAIGFVFYFIFGNLLKMQTVGIIAIAIFALIGFGIGCLKIPDSNALEITRKVGGEKIDEIIFRAIKFKMKKKRIYINTKEEQK